MRKLNCVWLLLFLFLSCHLSAQEKIRFGFRAGYSMATQYGITLPDIPYTVDTSYRHGLTGGFLINIPITESFSIQQELLYVQKGSKQDVAMTALPVETHTEYDLNYLEIPIVFRYNFVRLGQFKIYACSGFALSLLLNGEYRVDGVAEFGGVPIPFNESNKIEGLDTFDYAFLYGAGLDFELFGKDCFFEYRFTIGWNMLMMPTSEGGDPAPLRNQDYIFTLGMYF
jgi:hypothetical protein